MQLGHASLGQVGSGWVSWGHVGLNGVKREQKGVKSGQIEAKWGLLGTDTEFFIFLPRAKIQASTKFVQFKPLFSMIFYVINVQVMIKC